MYMRDAILCAVKTVKREKGFYFKTLDQVKEASVRTAIRKYAKGCAVSDVIALMDTTVFGSGKEGFILTENKMYGKKWNTPVSLEGLRRIESGRRESYICLIYDDNTTEEIYCSIYTDYMRELFTAIIDKAGEHILEETTQVEKEPVVQPEPKIIMPVVSEMVVQPEPKIIMPVVPEVVVQPEPEIVKPVEPQKEVKMPEVKKTAAELAAERANREVIMKELTQYKGVYKVASKVPKDVLENFIAQYAPGVRREDIILFYDWSEDKDGSSAAIVTAEMLYTNTLRIRDHKVPLTNIRQVKMTFDYNALRIWYESGICVELEMCETTNEICCCDIFDIVWSFQRMREDGRLSLGGEDGIKEEAVLPSIRLKNPPVHIIVAGDTQAGKTMLIRDMIKYALEQGAQIYSGGELMTDDELDEWDEEEHSEYYDEFGLLRIAIKKGDMTYVLNEVKHEFVFEWEEPEMDYEECVNKAFGFDKRKSYLYEFERIAGCIFVLASDSGFSARAEIIAESLLQKNILPLGCCLNVYKGFYDDLTERLCIIGGDAKEALVEEGELPMYMGDLSEVLMGEQGMEAELRGTIESVETDFNKFMDLLIKEFRRRNPEGQKPGEAWIYDPFENINYLDEYEEME